jgi:hypothetical protein
LRLLVLPPWCDKLRVDRASLGMLAHGDPAVLSGSRTAHGEIV